jgi:hypothetical protein
MDADLFSLLYTSYKRGANVMKKVKSSKVESKKFLTGCGDVY